MSITNQLFTEKFRPKTLDHLIAPERIKKELAKGLVQNILLYSTSPGTGKTSTLRILSKNYTTMFINASEEGRIDMVRDKLHSFCSTISLEGGKEKLKCVILDELDGASDEFFKALRAVVEKYVNVVRFIGSCNYLQKIPEPIQSRFNCISYDPINKDEEIIIFNEYKKRITIILNALKIKCDNEILTKFIKNNFPDMRSLMNKIQSLYLQNVNEINSLNFNINYDFIELFKLVCSSPDKPYDNYKQIINNYSSKINDCLIALGEDLPNYINNSLQDKIQKIPSAIITIAEYQSQLPQSIDKMVVLLACVFKLQMIINS